MLVREAPRLVVEPGRHRPALHAELRQGLRLVPDGLADVRAVGQLAPVRFGLIAVGGLDLDQVPRHGRRREDPGLQVLPRPGRHLALEARVVPQDPAVALLGVAQRVPREPLDAQARVGAAGGEVGEVAEDEDGGVGGADDADLDGLVGVPGGDGLGE